MAGNLVIGTALLVASRMLEANCSSIVGVELLPPLHHAALSALASLRALLETTEVRASLPLPRVLPHCAFACDDLAAHDISDADVCYLCSTAFTPSLLLRFVGHAAQQLKPGSRVITLTHPLVHPAFELEACIPSCQLSWGLETAYVHRKHDAAWEDGAGQLLAKVLATDGQALTEWCFSFTP